MNASCWSGTLTHPISADDRLVALEPPAFAERVSAPDLVLAIGDEMQEIVVVEPDGWARGRAITAARAHAAGTPVHVIGVVAR